MKEIEDGPVSEAGPKEPKPKYHLDIEGNIVPWFEDTITTEQIISLGGWEPTQGVILIDKENNERTLQPGEVIELKPGMGFSKKIRFKRGDSSSRMDQEFELLKRYFPEIQQHVANGVHWFLIKEYGLPPGWSLKSTSVAFHAQVAHPGAQPYGIYVPRGLTYNGQPPQNFTDVAPSQPPFDGEWAVLSWTPEDGEWKAMADIQSGSNLLNWALSFKHRFEGGA